MVPGNLLKQPQQSLLFRCLQNYLDPLPCYFKLAINPDAPDNIICMATAITINPVKRITGPAKAKNSNVLDIPLLVSISSRFISKAGINANKVSKVPYCMEKEIVAAIVPGPAINGAARGTIDNSS